MAKKKTGLFSLLFGAIAGALAVFFSDEKNRETAKKTFVEAKKDPEAFAKKVAKNVNTAAKKASVATKKASVKAKAKIIAKKEAVKKTMAK